MPERRRRHEPPRVGAPRTRRGAIARLLVAPVALALGGVGPEAGEASGAARLIVRPARALARSTVEVRGSGFPPAARGRLTWQPGRDGSRPLGAVRTDGQGRFRTTVRLPWTAASGAYLVAAKVGKKTGRAAVGVRLPAGAPVALGIYQPGAPASRQRIAQARRLLGAPPAILMWYQGWGAPGGSEVDPAWLQRAAAAGATPMVTWEPWDYRRGVNQPRFRLDRIAAGDFDAYVARWAEGLRAFGRPALLRFAHEMNGGWYPWGAGVNGNTPAAFRAAWQRVWSIFQDHGASNVAWVWSPNVSWDRAPAFADFYPGDQYVDWVGLDGYNFGSAQGGWRTFDEVFLDSIEAITRIAPSKPLMIAETAAVEQGGDKAAWIRDALGAAIPLRFPAIRAVVWFNERKTEFGQTVDYRIDSSDAARRAFAAAARNPYYRGPVQPTRRVERGARPAGAAPPRDAAGAGGAAAPRKRRANRRDRPRQG